MNPASTSTSIGKLVLDARANLLTSGGREIRLRPKMAQVLRYLAEHSGEVVSGEDLFRDVWNGIAVSPHALTVVIADLRRLLREHDDAIRIETHYGQGFRLQIDTAAPMMVVPAPEAAERSRLFVGRTLELARLHTAWRSIGQQQRQIVLFRGPAGIGKTALVDHFISDLGATGGVLLGRGRCVLRQSGTEELQPWLEALESMASEVSLLEPMQRYAPTWLAQLSWLLPAAEMFALRQSLASLVSRRTLREGVALFEALAATMPLAVVLEDLHWADPMSIDLLLELAKSPRAARLLVIATVRPADAIVAGVTLATSLASLRREKSVQIVDLDTLSAKGVQDYLDLRLSSGRLHSEAFDAFVTEKSAGLPLYVKELVDYSIERDWLVRRDEQWTVDPNRAPKAIEVPESIRDLLRAHLSAAAPDDVVFLEAASAAGSDFTPDEVAAALALPLDEVVERCRLMAERGQFIRYDGERTFPNGRVVDSYRFDHILHHQAVAGRLSRQRGASLHRRIGELLESTHGNALGDVASRLALHFELAGEPEKWAAYLEIAAITAHARNAGSEVVSLLEQSVAVLSTLPESIQRDERLAMRESQLGQAVMFYVSYCDRRSPAAFERAAAAAARAGRSDLEFHATSGVLYANLMSRSDIGSLIALVDRMMTLSRDRPALQCFAYLYSSWVQHGIGDYGRSLVDADAARTLLPAASSVPGERDPASLIAMARLLALAPQGHNEEVANEAAYVIGRFETHLGWGAQAAHLTTIAFASLEQRDAEATHLHAEKAVALCEDAGSDAYLTLARCCQAWANWARGTSSIEPLQQAVDERGQLPDRWFQVILMLRLAEAYIATGELAAGGRVLDAAGAVGVDPGYEAEFHRIRGVFAASSLPALKHSRAHKATLAAARGNFQQAVAVAERQSASLWAGWAREDLARLEG